MKKAILVLSLAAVSAVSFAQKKLVTTSATVSFDATTKLDALPKADNKAVTASLNTKSGDVAFEAVVKNFSFSNPKIQEHFNGAQWMDSDKYPTASFKGKITNLAAVKFGTDGTYEATVEGELTMHGVTQKVSAPATITVAGKAVSAKSDFSVKVADYNVNGPAIGAGKVATDPKITVLADFK
ncbi:MAG: YceI family protein [Ferruginibacter sp.]